MTASVPTALLRSIADTLRRVATDPFPARWRDRFALIVAIVAFAAGTHAFMNLEPRSGIHLEVQEGPGIVGEAATEPRVVVSWVEPWSQAWRNGIREGMVVVDLGSEPILGRATVGWPPASKEDLWWMASMPIFSLTAIDATDADRYRPDIGFDGPMYTYWSDAPWALDNSGWAIGLGFLILLVGAWYLTTGRGGAGLQPLAIPIAVASSIPLPLLALDLLEPDGPAVATLLLVLGLLPLADGASTGIEDALTRRGVRITCFGIAALLGVVALDSFGNEPINGGWRLLGAAAIPLLPAVIASRPRASALAEAGATASRRAAESSELVLVSLTPAIAALTMTIHAYTPLIWPVLLWIAALLVASRFTVRPLLRLATRAQLQRDLVVAAMEAERARLAADLHDEALQDLTLLVRRLDAAGDTESAAQARAIADRLREICGDLRLPILDDLGVGPALDWLVVRIERLAGGEVRLERVDGASRPPADVELAVFRVAQEALANAVKHGRPPIVVRYRADGSGVSLSIDDAGPGIDTGAREEATTGGHFGLLNMQQRAEQIGALLDVRRWPGGGTHVALEWRAG